jgi:hydrogenase expression/formation protein HypC
MCLGVPGQVVEVHGDHAVVDFWGTRKQVNLEIVKETVLPGDYIIDHLGYAIRRIAPAEVADTLAMYEVVLCETGVDPLEYA